MDSIRQSVQTDREAVLPDLLFEAPSLHLRSDGRIAELRLARPKLLNRFDEVVHTDLTNALATLEAHTEIRAVLVTADGPVFSAGGDFDVMRRLYDSRELRVQVLGHGRDAISDLLAVSVPTISCVHGDAIGLGATIALTCDLVVASRAANIVDPHVAIGLVAGDGGCVVWPQSIGTHAAKRFLLTGDPLPASRAFEMGLVTDLVDTADEVRPAALALASRIAALPPLAVQGTKRVLNQALRARAEEVLELGFAYEIQTAATEDFVEALSAIAERRPPAYQGL